MYSALDTFESLFMKEKHASSIGKNISNKLATILSFSMALIYSLDIDKEA